MKCVPRETEEFECFYLTIYNIDKFVQWVTKLYTGRKYPNRYYYHDDILTVCLSDKLDFDCELNRWYVWKDSLYDYDEDVFNQIYRMI